MALNQANTRERLRHLVSIPESDRTDIQWNEIHHLELEVVRQPHREEPGKPPVKKRATPDRPSETQKSIGEKPIPSQPQEPVKKKPVTSYLRSRQRNERRTKKG